MKVWKAEFKIYGKTYLWFISHCLFHALWMIKNIEIFQLTLLPIPYTHKKHTHIQRRAYVHNTSTPWWCRVVTLIWASSYQSSPCITPWFESVHLGCTAVFMTIPDIRRLRKRSRGKNSTGRTCSSKYRLPFKKDKTSVLVLVHHFSSCSIYLVSYVAI